MGKALAIARNAFLEAIRQPIFFVMILVTMSVLVLTVPMADYTMGRGDAAYAKTDQQWLIIMGLSTLLMSGLLVASFTAAGVVSREIEDRTILTVLSKPVSRPTVVVGKYLGVSLALLLSMYISTLAFLLTVRHHVMPTSADQFDAPVIFFGWGGLKLALLGALFLNYFFGWNWISTAVSLLAVFLTIAMALVSFIGKGWVLISLAQTFSEDIPPDVLYSVLLVMLAVLVFSAVAVAASTRLGQVSTLLVCLSFFAVGSLTQNLFGQHTLHASAALAYKIFPDLTFFYTMDALQQQEGHVPGGYVGFAALYALVQIVAILAVGIALFQGRELERTGSSSAAPRLVSWLAWLGRSAGVAMALAALVPPVSLGTVMTIVYVVAMLVAAAGNWLFWGWFGRGVRWTYYLFIVAAAMQAVGGVVALATRRTLPLLDRPLSVALVVVTALVLGLMLLPQNRFHFGLAAPTKRRRMNLSSPERELVNADK